ncbi:MAG: response regulator transcription factor [candidate division NC10 bacterium]
MCDYPVLRLGLRAILKAPDLRVVGETATREEALSLVESRNPDIVLLGCRVAGEEGLDLLARIKRGWPRVSVVIVTIPGSDIQVSRALALGCSGYLLETLDGPALRKAIRDIARGECVIEPGLLRDLLTDLSREMGTRWAQASRELTAPEREVLRLITEGQTNRQIAQRLRHSLGTVKDYCEPIRRTCRAVPRLQAPAYQQPPDPVADRGEHLRHLGIARPGRRM